MAKTNISSQLDHDSGAGLLISRGFSELDNTSTEAIQDLNITLAGLASNIAVDLCQIATLKLVFIECDAPIRVAFDTSDTVPIPVRSFATITTDVVVSPTTGVFLSNPDVDPVVVRVIAVGE